MTEPVSLGLGGLCLILLAGFIVLSARFARLRAEADLLFAAGALDADQASSLRGDLARRRAVTRIVTAQRDAAMTALHLALAELSAVRAENVLLGEAADAAITAADRITGRPVSIAGVAR